MWSIQRILVPTDFGEPSVVALDRAVDLARRVGASITLLHAYEIAVYGPPAGPLFAPIELTASVEQASRRALENMMKVHEECGVSIQAVLREGAPWRVILAVANELGADLITMGTHGRRGLPRALLGSVAERVVRMSPIPVLVARGDAARPADAPGEPAPTHP